MNQTTEFLGASPQWRGANLTLDEVHGLWGGWLIRVGGNGRVVIKGVPPSAPATQLQKRLSVEQVKPLFQQCVDSNLLAIQFPPRESYIPDESHTTLILTNEAGEVWRLTRWAHDPPHEGFETMVVALKALT